jgi:pSer/pThr/pTyr-binding forkhead associated (FHA) protein
MMKVKLLINRGSNKGKSIAISRSPFLIGRDPDCHLRPHSATISRRHCAIIAEGDQLFIRDFGSTNGTLVNDQRVLGQVELHHADRLQVDRLSFEVQIEKTPSASKPAPPDQVRSEAIDDDTVASLFLALGDDAPRPAVGANEPERPAKPDDSTVLNVPAIDSQLAVAQTPVLPPKKKDSRESSTAVAAKAILAKYKKQRRDKTAP